MNSQQPDVNQQPIDYQNRAAAGDPAVVIPVVEEQVRINKQVVESGKVRISKSVTEHQELVNVPVSQEEVQVERIAVNQYVETAPPPVRYEGDTMIIPVVREVMVVEKRLLLVEELRVTKKEVQRQETQEITLRKEEVHIERVAGANPGDNVV